MSIKNIGAIKDVDGSKVYIGWEAKGVLGSSDSWKIYLRFKDSWWIEQESVEVRNSQEAHSWAKEKVKSGKGLRKKERII
ncbi:hypothetical protein HN784_00600 [bacterium]|jgi:hypothetical protein|nr:hypothetical protein [bacterium]MBT4251577.1 hypothetical protein [bacterium]MBT4597626.1 hypothetical protein [bacterium]MBT6753640.1 hypothetical protein [bacterium]MBT7037777.1 hypothetical protein [bacterium]